MPMSDMESTQSNPEQVKPEKSKFSPKSKIAFK